MEFPLNRRKHEFPYGAKDVLKELEKSGSRILKGAADVRYVRDLQSGIDEHVFCMVDMKGIFTKRLTCLQELQLTELLIDFFNETASGSAEISKNVSYNNFLVLFFGGQAERDKSLLDARLDVLIKAISLSAQLKCSALLNHTASWMLRHLQQKPPSDHMIRLADQLISDYCNFTPDDLWPLIDLVKESTTFASILFPMVFENYEIGRSPPLPYFRVVADWLATNQKSFCKNLRGGDALKNSTYAKFFTHNFARFLCVDVVRSLDVGLTRDWRLVLSRMHLSALQFLILCSKSGVEPAKFLPARVLNCCLAAIHKFSEDHPAHSDIFNEALDKLTQLIQMCCHCKFLLGVSKNDVDPALIAKFYDHALLQYVFDHCF